MSDLLICIQPQDFLAEIPQRFFLPESHPVVLCGPTECLQRPRIAILNSRQSPRLKRENAWVQKTLEALRSFDPKGTALVSSLGTTPWDFLSWAGGRLGFPLILVFSAGSAQNFNVVRTRAIMDLGLDDAKTLAVRPLGIRMGHQRAEAGALRDTWVLALAHRLVPVSIRPKGNLESYLSHSQLEAKAQLCQFEIEYEAPRPIRKPAITGKIRLPDWYQPDDYLIHWTRSCVGPWPDESRANFFQRAVEGGEEDSDGIATLGRILKEGVIRASGRLIRGRYSVVPFTERPPQDIPELIKYRAGLRRWTFEPYGIALKKAKLVEMGTRPVIYGEISDYERLAEKDRPFFQVAGSGKRDWRREKEWRIRGDVRLKSFSSEEVVAITHNDREAAGLAKICSYRILSLTDKS